jgi:putative hydrolase
VEDNVRAALDAGLEEVAITDHGPASLGWVGIRDRRAWDSMRRDVAAANAAHPDISVLSGVEANVTGLEGQLDVSRERLRELDMVLAGLHLEIWPRSLRDGVRLVFNNIAGPRASRRLARRARNDNTKALVEAVLVNDINIVVHPGLKLSVDTSELARACAARGTAMEINCHHGLTTPDYIEVAARHGVKFAISSDAHRPEEVGKLEAGRHLAAVAGLEPGQVINARH